MSKITLTPKLFPVLFAAGTVAGPILYAIAGANTGFAASQSSDGASDVVFAGVPDDDYTLTETRTDDAGNVLGTPFTQSFTVASPAPQVSIGLPSGATVAVSADDPAPAPAPAPAPEPPAAAPTEA